jgi:hypothetical protein
LIVSIGAVRKNAAPRSGRALIDKFLRWRGFSHSRGFCGTEAAGPMKIVPAGAILVFPVLRSIDDVQDVL